MTQLLDPPAAAARRQWALDRMIESLVGWGCPIESAPARARELLDHVLNVGYALPVALQPAPGRGTRSTPEGRAAARATLDATLASRRQRGVDATEAPREPGQPPAGQDRTGAGVSDDPANRPSASQGVGA